MAAMQHRHLDTLRLSTAAIASILERGGASDILSLMRALRADPDGEVAAAALRAADASEVYGYPELIRACLRQWRKAKATTRAGTD
jgi:hypothetical protein